MRGVVVDAPGGDAEVVEDGGTHRRGLIDLQEMAGLRYARDPAARGKRIDDAVEVSDLQGAVLLTVQDK